MDIGFIGLGTMGSRIAENLVKKGHQLRVWNRSRPPVDALARLGATPVSTAREAFSGDAVFSMLADESSEVMRAVKREDRHQESGKKEDDHLHKISPGGGF